jgi:arylformamidase
MQYIDLSVAINGQTAVYPGDPPFKVSRMTTVAKDGFESHEVSLFTHAGTHIDAPSHMLEGDKTLDDFGVEHFVGRGRLVPVGEEITLDAVQAVDIQAGDIVLLYTGKSEVYGQDGYFENYPAIPESVAQYLAGKKVKMVGVDTFSVDHGEFVAHKLLFKNDILIIENLVNLKALEGKEFTVYALPLKLQVDGAPARVIAEVKESA